MLNSITIMGRIGKDIELRRTNNGHAVCAFSLAVDRDYKENGNKATDWINCVAWRQNAEYVSKYGTKGRMVGLEGRLQSRSYEDKNNNKRTVWEVMVNNLYFADKVDTASNTTGDTTTHEFAEIETDDDLPF